MAVANPTNTAPKNITLTPNYSNTATLTGSNYYGVPNNFAGSNAPTTNNTGGSYPAIPSWVDFYQDWYTIPGSALSTTTAYGLNLTINSAIADPNLGLPNAVLSIQNSAGQQLAYSTNAGNPASILFTPPSTTDTYTIIVSQDQAGPPNTNYTLLIQPVTGPETVQTKVGQPFNSTFPAWWTPPTNPNIIWGGGTTTENDGGTPYPPMTSVTVTATAKLALPTGQVQLTVGTMALPPQTLTNGSATFQFATPAVGTYPLSTSYTQTGGNFASTPSSPSGVSLVVQQIPFNVAGTPTPGGPPVNGTITTGTPIYNGFDETLLGYNLGQENQDYYLVNLTAGSTYVITMASNFGLSWMSLQDPTGKQCAYCAYGNGFGSGDFPVNGELVPGDL